MTRQLESRFGAIIDSLRVHGDGLWFIRRVEVEFDCDLEFDDARIGKNWVRVLAQSLSRHLSAEQSEQLCYFRDQGHYLATFITDLALGNAWRQWYYRAFDGLRALTTSTALRTALLRDPAWGLDALQQLSLHDRARVLGALGEIEAKRTLLGLANAVLPGPSDTAGASQAGISLEVFNTLVQRLQESRHTPILPDPTGWMGALNLYLEALTRHPQSHGPALANICFPLCKLLQGAPIAESLRQALLNGAIASLYRQFPVDEAACLQPLFELPASHRDALLWHLASDEPVVRTGVSRYSAFGGMFLLLPLLARLPLERLTADWPRPAEQEPAAIIRLILLDLCWGHFPGIFRDSLLRDLLGIDGTLTFDELNNWFGGVSTETVLLAQRRLIDQRLAELGDPDVHGFVVERDRRFTVVVTEQRKGGWLILHETDIDPMQHGLHTLRKLLPETCRLQHADAGEKCEDDLQAVRLPQNLDCPDPLASLLRCLAQNLLRDFAMKLPGFSQSSIGYLRRNFLAFDATLHPHEEIDRVRLGHPTLHLVLNMTGMLTEHYRLPWRERPLVLES